jgi:hypothetical protein
VPRIAATDFGGTYYPLVTIDLVFPHGSMPALVCVDSGADSTLITAEAMAAVPGYDWGTIPGPFEVSGGAGGRFETKVVTAEAWWNGQTVCDQFRVVGPGSNMPWGLVGRDDFFRQYVVRFMWHRSPPQFDLDPVTAPPKKHRSRKP